MGWLSSSVLGEGVQVAVDAAFRRDRTTGGRDAADSAAEADIWLAYCTWWARELGCGGGWVVGQFDEEAFSRGR